MITTAFDKAFGTTELCLSEMILKVHDAVPNRDKRHWRLLSKATEAMLGQRAPDLGAIVKSGVQAIIMRRLDLWLMA